jgi:hypothetical protein
MKISFIQTETRTLRSETKRQTDVVCEFSPVQNGCSASVWEKLKKICRWLIGIICIVIFITGAGLIDATVVKVDAANDLALLKVVGKFTPLPVAASRGVKLGGTMATVGFPTSVYRGSRPSWPRGKSRRCPARKMTRTIYKSACRCSRARLEFKL